MTYSKVLLYCQYTEIDNLPLILCLQYMRTATSAAGEDEAANKTTYPFCVLVQKGQRDSVVQSSNPPNISIHKDVLYSSSRNENP